MPFITAQQIHNGHGWLPEGSTIEVSDTGTIIAVHEKPNSETKFYEGVLAPGFVNAHCHLELSHMKGLVAEHTGLIPFLKSIPAYRNNFSDEQKKEARQKAYHELYDNGVVAVGDIANTTDTMDVRMLDKLHVHTFVESLGFSEANAERSFEYAVQTYDAFAAQQTNTKTLLQSIVPHAPYSVSSSLFRFIDKHRNGGVVVSVHNQESEEEDKFYISNEGGVRDLLHSLGIDDSLFTASGKSSIQSYLEWMDGPHRFMFVHNTFTKRGDVQYAHNKLQDVYWCLCPNANLYIENTLPDIAMFIGEGARMCIGTDSLASNHQLCIMSELWSIKTHCPDVSWGTLLTWATKNGAEALRMQDVIGTIDAGKTPGILQITGLSDSTQKAVVNRLF